MDYTDDEIRKLRDEATPGPWRRGGTDAKPVPVVSATDKVHGYQIHSMLHHRDSESWPFMVDTWNRDARLIAAAPTLASLLLSARAELAAVREAVAPPGSIPPAEHARAVREAWFACCPDWLAPGWPTSSARRDLIATLTRHGTPQPEAERLADGAQEVKP